MTKIANVIALCLMCVCLVTTLNAELVVTNGDFENYAGGDAADVLDWYDYDSGGWWVQAYQRGGATPTGSTYLGFAGIQYTTEPSWAYQSIGVNDVSDAVVRLKFDIGSMGDADSARDLGVVVSVFESDGTFAAAQNVNVDGAAGVTLIDSVSLSYPAMAPGASDSPVILLDLSAAGTGELFLHFENAGDYVAIDNVVFAGIDNPSPSDEEVLVNVKKVLSWSAPVDDGFDPAFAITYDFYMDPNDQLVDSGVGCLYTASGISSTEFAPPADLEILTTYYWKVDANIQLVGDSSSKVFVGTVLSFTTSPLDAPPVVDAGGSIITTLDLATAPNQIALNGSVVNDETSAMTVIWEAYEVAWGGPTSKVTFADATDPATTVTISEVGTYALKLSATDATGTVTGQKEIIVFESDCEAAKATGSYTTNYYDRDDNCVVDMSDFAVFAEEWLNSNALADSFYYDATVNSATSEALVAEYWLDITEEDPNDLLNDPRYPAEPDAAYFIVDGLTSTYSADNYGQRIRGYIVPPVSGDYIFYITSDNASRLFLSSDTTPVDTDPALGNQIAEVPGVEYAAIDQWDKFPEQSSASVTLTAGQYYYIEIIHKENTGGDYVSVGWSTDGGATIEVVPGTALRYALP